MFLHKQRTLSAVTFLFLPLGLSLFVLNNQVNIFACCAGMFVWFQQILKRLHVVSDKCNAFLVL